MICVLSRGSVVVTFDLWFNQLIDEKEAEQQLEAGLHEAEATGLVIDTNSIQITGDTVRSLLSLGTSQRLRNIMFVFVFRTKLKL